eukprot:Opistho-2@55649
MRHERRTEYRYHRYEMDSECAQPHAFDGPSVAVPGTLFDRIELDVVELLVVTPDQLWVAARKGRAPNGSFAFSFISRMCFAAAIDSAILSKSWSSTQPSTGQKLFRSAYLQSRGCSSWTVSVVRVLVWLRDEISKAYIDVELSVDVDAEERQRDSLSVTDGMSIGALVSGITCVADFSGVTVMLMSPFDGIGDTELRREPNTLLKTLRREKDDPSARCRAGIALCVTNSGIFLPTGPHCQQRIVQLEMYFARLLFFFVSARKMGKASTPMYSALI